MWTESELGAPRFGSCRLAAIAVIVDQVTPQSIQEEHNELEGELTKSEWHPCDHVPGRLKGSISGF